MGAPIIDLISLLHVSGRVECCLINSLLLDFNCREEIKWDHSGYSCLKPVNIVESDSQLTVNLRLVYTVNNSVLKLFKI